MDVLSSVRETLELCLEVCQKLNIVSEDCSNDILREMVSKSPKHGEMPLLAFTCMVINDVIEFHKLGGTDVNVDSFVIDFMWSLYGTNENKDEDPITMLIDVASLYILTSHTLGLDLLG